jgi:BTB/POZ domain-containing protein 9
MESVDSSFASAAQDNSSTHNETADSGANAKLTRFKNYSPLARHLQHLVGGELFADVYFEVDGHIVPAHRNILVTRSEYFRAMLSSSGSFKESRSNKPIYIGNIAYDIFMQMLNYLYTGHLDTPTLPYYTCIALMRLADRMNMLNLEDLCLFYLSEMINKENAVKIFREAFEGSPPLDKVASICYEAISPNFAYVSRSVDFCSLPQESMLKLIENVVPKLSRLNSEQLREPPNDELQHHQQ